MKTHFRRRGMMALVYAVLMRMSNGKCVGMDLMDTVDKVDIDVGGAPPLRGAPLCRRPVNLAVHWPDASITGEIVARGVGQRPSYP